MDFTIASGWKWFNGNEAVPLLKKHNLLSHGNILLSESSLTNFLEAINLSPVTIEIKRNEICKIEKKDADYLEVDASQDAIIRDVWLVQAGKKLVYAHSVFPIAGLNKNLLEKISASIEPLGRRLTDQGMLTLKDKLEVSAVWCAEVNRELGLPPENTHWAKHYRLLAKPADEGKGIVASVTEIFSHELMGKPPQNGFRVTN